MTRTNYNAHPRASGLHGQYSGRRLTHKQEIWIAGVVDWSHYNAFGRIVRRLACGAIADCRPPWRPEPELGEPGHLAYFMLKLKRGKWHIAR
jgi:hypothetical protein